jgi:hypothetical protein
MRREIETLHKTLQQKEHEAEQAEEMKRVCDEKFNALPWLAAAYADHVSELIEENAAYLKNQTNQTSFIKDEIKIKAYFVTSTALSETAKKFAEYLGVSYKESLPLGDYPRIKCNINHSTGERIYHLPFDQQYNRTTITHKTGERYAYTVAEAEEKGFRRARRGYYVSSA